MPSRSHGNLQWSRNCPKLRTGLSILGLSSSAYHTAVQMIFLWDEYGMPVPILYFINPKLCCPCHLKLLYVAQSRAWSPVRLAHVLDSLSSVLLSYLALSHSFLMLSYVSRLLFFFLVTFPLVSEKPIQMPLLVWGLCWHPKWSSYLIFCIPIVKILGTQMLNWFYGIFNLSLFSDSFLLFCKYDWIFPILKM